MNDHDISRLLVLQVRPVAGVHAFICFRPPCLDSLDRQTFIIFKASFMSLLIKLLVGLDILVWVGLSSSAAVLLSIVAVCSDLS